MEILSEFLEFLGIEIMEALFKTLFHVVVGVVLAIAVLLSASNSQAAQGAWVK